MRDDDVDYDPSVGRLPRDRMGPGGRGPIPGAGPGPGMGPGMGGPLKGVALRGGPGGTGMRTPPGKAGSMQNLAGMGRLQPAGGQGQGVVPPRGTYPRAPVVGPWSQTVRGPQRDVGSKMEGWGYVGGGPGNAGWAGWEEAGGKRKERKGDEHSCDCHFHVQHAWGGH